MIRYIEPDGFLRVRTWVGCRRTYSTASGSASTAGNGTLYGVVGTKPGHILFSSAGAEQREYPGDRLTGPAYDDLFVDVGARSADEVAEMGLRNGLEVTYDRDLQWLGDGRHGLVTCRALDDRTGRPGPAGDDPTPPRGRPEAPRRCLLRILHPGGDGAARRPGRRRLRPAGHLHRRRRDHLCLRSGIGDGVVRSPCTSAAEAPSFLGGGVGISSSDQSAPVAA